MTYEELIKRLDPAVYQSLKRALELGKWPDGRKLSDEQRSICMEAVIYYEDHHNTPMEERVGYLDRGEKAGTACDPSVSRTAGKSSNGTAGSDQYFEVKS
ncbi:MULTISPECIES: YeaC family protein [Marinobacter]|jgi:uncharacterized protein YeaC (DUF1315 family)|uniref:DUF1315 domain-containing protein n=1 Tax=Marinobacter salarius TaxID=1420917 RepID=W5YSG6_9GAMM|nr:MULTISPECIES: DUF1315 family protein [Marinobacter]AHI32086.1 hypothetical protein AU15_14900 [Marinobacter salarius]ARM84924.1 hypothetical protein MARSALSMR5_02877 [Marinobacter salarius]AZR39833.1 uncharacterized protein MTMN5_00361 [Marinobacter salarius]KXJ44425.1 MAG: hypothetical protein AXW11_15425 [Marinobacter sp. Hex_13]MAB52294.1 DUF1315 domain-containing protein [Marinobacter sp.]|tara:strand:+ start:144 stop:443 length:300 start_codon:yes stop_codon:yes gene_type:complete|eukprot:TRINITY_DN7910_c0_g1_i1.p1 TRINITY_DN7910_c0_g1~~TRINITY_DN7910_c0_g1_i1.p1  ORF type:complete len:100 (+),score=7.37 TRINITY_DN7910_c0_g1_i1:112-411(+)